MPRDSLARALAAQALAAGGGAPAWGSITGTLASQADLNTALGAKATGTGTANGTNTGDQTITLTGNVTGSGTGSFATTIAAGAVTLAMQANMATGSLIYRKTAGAGAPEVNTLATLKTDLGLTGTNSGDQTITLTGNVTGSGTGSFATTVASVPAAAMPALTGDVTTSAGAVATTIAAAAVSLAKMANLAANSIIGNNTGSPATPLALTTLPTSLMPALTGDVTNSAGALATTIAANAVTFAKFQQVAASSLVGNPTGSLANAAAITLAGGLAFSGSTLTAAGALTPTSVASTGAITTSSATAGIGYATGAGGTVTQATSRTTGVTLSKPCGTITLVSAAGSATWNTFTVTNTLVAATDTIEVSQKSGANLYNVIVTAVAAGSFNLSVSAVSGTATESPAFNFVIVKGVAA